MAREIPTLLTVLVVAACSGKDPARGGTASATSLPAGTVVIDTAQRTQITTETIAPVSFTASVVTTGTVEFNGNQSTQVLAPISGPVSRILASSGMRVTRGQPLAMVASPDFAAAVAAYRKADDNWHNAERIFKLNEQLFANDALARRDLDQSRTDLSDAAADRDAAESQLTALGATPTSTGNEAAIRAPIAGTVVEKLINPGQLLQAGTTPCFTIADLSSVWVIASVFGADVGAVKAGERVYVTTDATTDSFPGRVDYVAALVDPATKATNVRLLVPNPTLVLKRDMLVRVTIQAARQRTGLLVPVAAVLRDDENLPFLFVKTAEGTFARRRIDLGGRVGDRYEITSGLKPGETVVTHGGLFLEGQGAP